jgi:hypothetical protein
VVVLKVAQDQDPSDPGRFWAPSELDQIEAIAASYVPTTGNASVRLVNLSPYTKLAGMMSASGAATRAISDVHYGLASPWKPFPAEPQTFSFFDDVTSHPTKIYSVQDSPAGPLIGSSQFLLGMGRGGAASLAVRAVLVRDALEGGVCKPE